MMSDSVQFALFTGFYTGVYRAVLCGLRNLLREDSMLGAYCAGYLGTRKMFVLPR